MPTGADPASQEQAAAVLARLQGGSLRNRRSGSLLSQLNADLTPYALGGAQQPYSAYTAGTGAGWGNVMPLGAEFTYQNSGRHIHTITTNQVRPVLFPFATSQDNLAVLLPPGQGVPPPLTVVMDYQQVAGSKVHFSIRINDQLAYRSPDLPFDGTTFPVTPGLLARFSGKFHYRLVTDGQLAVDEDFVQKALVFDQPFPNVLPANSQPFQFNNSFHWDDNSPLVNPRWNVRVHQDNQIAEKSGQSPQMAFSWDSAQHVLAAFQPPPESSGIRFDYTIKIGSDGVGPGPYDVAQNQDVASPQLLVENAQGTLYAIGNGLTVAEESPEQRLARRQPLQEVRAATGPWQLKAVNLSETGPLTVRVHSTVSQVSETVTLTKGPDGVYVGSLPDPGHFLRPNPPVAGQPAQQRLALASTTPAGPALFDLLLGLPASLNFPSPRVALGRLETAWFIGADSPEWRTERFKNEPVHPLDNLVIAPTHRDNVLAAGFETLQFELAASGRQLQANVKTSHASQVYVANLHGLHDSGDLVITDDGGQHLPASFASGLPTDLATLILESCEVLDLRDYNNFFSTDHYSGLTSDPAAPNPIAPHPPDGALATRKSPGAAWYGQTVSRNVQNLLGYAAPAPELALGASLPGRLAAQNLNKNLALAWLQANQQAAREVGNAWLCLNACAYQKGNYYYLPYKVPSGQGTFDRQWPAPLQFPHVDPSTIKAFGIYSVPISRWAREATDWSVVPQDVAVPVSPQ